MKHLPWQHNRWQLAGALGLALGLLVSSAAAAIAAPDELLAAGAGITGTAHDFILQSRGIETRVCVQCHAPHQADAAAPEWNPKLAISAYSLYSAVGTVIRVGEPGVYSRLCLSCHDGTLGVLNYSGVKKDFLLGGGKLGRTAFNKQFAMRDHPIGVGYGSERAISDSSMADPESETVVMVATKPSHNQTKSGSISMMMLAEGQVECTSCHDVHNRYTVGPSNRGLVKVGLHGSALCQVCHKK